MEEVEDSVCQEATRDWREVKAHCGSEQFQVSTLQKGHQHNLWELRHDNLSKAEALQPKSELCWEDDTSPCWKDQLASDKNSSVWQYKRDPIWEKVEKLSSTMWTANLAKRLQQQSLLKGPVGTTIIDERTSRHNNPWERLERKQPLRKQYKQHPLIKGYIGTTVFDKKTRSSRNP